MQPDPAKLDAFMGKMLGDMGAAACGRPRAHRRQARAVQGPGRDRAGHPDGARRARPAPPSATSASGCAAQAAGGYVVYDPASGTYSMTAGAGDRAGRRVEPRVRGRRVRRPRLHVPGRTARSTAAFKSGKGVGWHEHDPCLFRGTERFFRPGYVANLVQNWLPALDGVVAKLERGAQGRRRRLRPRRLDHRHGEAFPNSKFTGFDYHAPSIERPARRPREAGVADRVHVRGRRRPRTSRAPATTWSRIFDCLHDMGDPVGAARSTSASPWPRTAPSCSSSRPPRTRSRGT